MSGEAELVLDARADLGEGALWDSKKQVLYWIDINGFEVHIYDPSTQKDRVINVGQYVGTIVPRKSGGVILGVHHGIASLDLETEELKIIADPDRDAVDCRMNDGKCDPSGRFWVGTLKMGSRADIGSLYCMELDLSVTRKLEKVTISNGIVWSKDNRTMYYIDTPTRKVDAFDYDLETGNISDRRAVIEIPEEMGFPDGMAIDSDDNLWIALFGGSSVARWDPSSGKLLERIMLPVPNATSCAFGGANLDQLYITTAREGMDEAALTEYPLGGGLFRADVGIKGTPAYEFGG